MAHLCTKCGITWSCLWTIDSDSEDYDVCPECMVDNHLQLSDDPDTYFKCRFTGKVISTRTGKRKEEQIFEPPPFEPYRWITKYKFRQTIPRNH